ncbi:MAG: hypothetical protein LC624_08395 [Halobacteriales archaeon]|nr:hypothetical protein [Halobacteriales archaeon]
MLGGIGSMGLATAGVVSVLVITGATHPEILSGVQQLGDHAQALGLDTAENLVPTADVVGVTGLVEHKRLGALNITLRMAPGSAPLDLGRLTVRLSATTRSAGSAGASRACRATSPSAPSATKKGAWRRAS